jgi:UDP-2,3-diacylglucosamine hydrolase
LHRTDLTQDELGRDAVFISDLHLHPDNDLITQRFYRFLDWAQSHVSTVYILGDFFHVWPGDDGLDAWSKTIAMRLQALSKQGVAIYFMHGNRDFLIGKEFADLAGMTLISEPTVIPLGKTPVLLVHGDRYCTKDRAHQWFRTLTRNPYFSRLFLMVPFAIRNKLVHGVRKYSRSGQYQPETMDVVAKDMLHHMQSCQVATVIHGHTHKPGMTTHDCDGQIFRQFVLSDWDDSPQVLCYHKSKGLYFMQIGSLES